MDTNQFLEDIAEDFFAECDELLSQIRNHLLSLDELDGRVIPSKKLLEEILRGFHTLKGLTGMMGAEKIMNVTHSLENFFKAFHENNSVISKDSLDKVFSAEKLIESQFKALREKSEMPDDSATLKELDSIVPLSGNKKKHFQYPVTETPPESEEDLPYILNDGEKIWNFSFTPSKELFDRGININEVRRRIQDAGRVLNSIPRVRKDGTIIFEFTVASSQPEETFMKWPADGILYSSKEELHLAPKTTENFQENHFQNTQKHFVRVDLNRLDDIMQTIGDLVISRLRLTDQISFIAAEELTRGRGNALQETNILIERQLKDLRERIIKLRLVPIGEAFEKMKFVVRDLIRDSGKSINLVFVGQETQVDKYVMEKIFEPLLHLVRNAVSHGMETPGERVSAGKSSEGRLLLKASASGDVVIFTIEDDGVGIDRDNLIEKAISEKIISPETPIDDQVILDIICTPGFSIRQAADMVSGRGVGMNVVKTTIDELSGTLSFTSVKGIGTSFIIQLPLSLSIVNALIVSANNNLFAIPMSAVNEILRIAQKDLIKAENFELISYRDDILPFLRLSRKFNLGKDNDSYMDAMVTGHGKERLVIGADRIIGQKEVVVRSLADPMIRVEGISGATELGEGKIVLVLDSNAIIRSTLRKKVK